MSVEICLEEGKNAACFQFKLQISFWLLCVKVLAGLRVDSFENDRIAAHSFLFIAFRLSFAYFLVGTSKVRFAVIFFFQ